MLIGMKAVVAGGGIGGLAVARALAMKGAHVTLLEQAAEITEVGAGIQVSPNGLAVLRGLGLEHGFKGAGFKGAGAVRGRAVVLVDRGGSEVLRMDLGRLGGQEYHFIHRADLIGVLEAGAREVGVNIELNARVMEIGDGPAPKVTLEDGRVFHGDLVAAADGLHSVGRPVLNGAAQPFFTGQVAWRAVIPNDLNKPPEARVHMGRGRHLVSYPLRGGEMLNLVAVQERRGWAEESWSARDEPDNLRAAFADFGDEAQAMLSRVDQVHLWGLFRHEVAAAWYGQGLALLGDAAHPTLPFMAQGAVMALEDAWVLADALGRAEDVGAGLARYQARRRDRVVRAVNAASGNAWKYHLRFPPLRFAAHSALRVAGWLAPDRMVRQFDWLYGYDVTAEEG